MINGIEAIAPAMITNIESIAVKTTTTTQAEFGNLITQGLNNVNADISKSESLLKAYAVGENVPSHELMMALEEAKLSLQFAVELRNKVVEAYQEISRMQV